uniref:RAN binding protein 3 n=1 Tax=Latimeria chalumnae TaxID=7897 RepID=H3AZY5_LATCH
RYLLLFSYKPAIAPPVFVFQNKAQKRSADGSSPEEGEDSDKEDGGYCPPMKRERSSSQNQFPPSQSVAKNNVFMPSSFSQPSTGNSDSEPEERSVGFRLKPPTLIHGQAPSAEGLPSQKPKEQQRSVLRPPLLQAPQPKAFSQTVPSSGTNGLNKPSDPSLEAPSELSDSTETPEGSSNSTDTEKETKVNESDSSSTKEEGKTEKTDQNAQSDFVFGQNLRDRVKLDKSSAENSETANSGTLATETTSATNYFLQYINSSVEGSANSVDSSSAKFVFGQNMSDRVLSLPKLSESGGDCMKETASAGSGSESSSQENTPEKLNSATESLVESAAAYTKATAKKCLLEKVEVITGEEAESNVLQMQCKLFVFDKTSQSWVERGRGLLRLNDMASTDDGTLQSRLEQTTKQNSLKRSFPPYFWAPIRPHTHNVRINPLHASGAPPQGNKFLLNSASSKDTGQLYAAIHHRILALRSRVEQEQETKTATEEPGVTQSNEEDSDDDDDVLAPTGTDAGPNESGDGQTAGST